MSGSDGLILEHFFTSDFRICTLFNVHSECLYRILILVTYEYACTTIVYNQYNAN